MCHKNDFLFGLLVTSTFSIHYLMVKTILTQNQNVGNQINTFEELGIKLTYDIKYRDQIHNLLVNILLPS